MAGEATLEKRHEKHLGPSGEVAAGVGGGGEGGNGGVKSLEAALLKSPG